jgi:hypothetical protein
MWFDSRFLVLALSVSTALAFGSCFAYAQDKPANGRETLESLVKSGFEIKAMERGTERAPFIVLLQRGTDIKSCILRIRRNGNATPSRESVCF